MMIKQHVTFLLRDINYQSSNYYQLKVDQLMEYTYPLDCRKLQILLQEMSQYHPQITEVQNFHNHLIKPTRRQYDQLLDLLQNKFLIKFLQSTSLIVFIIFLHIIYRRIDETRQIAQKIYHLLHSEKMSCCVYYLQLLKWLRHVFQVKKMVGFIQFIKKDLLEVEEPLFSLYQSQLQLNLRFCKRESGQIALKLNLSKKAVQNLNIEEDLYDQFRTHYLKRDYQKMIQQKEKIFMLQYVPPEIKTYCCVTIGNTMFAKGRVYEAIGWLQQAMSYNHNQPRIHYQLANCYFFLQQWNKLSKTIQYFENHDMQLNYKFLSQAWAMKGKAIYQLNKKTEFNENFDQQHFNKAYQYCSKALEYNENNFIACETLTFIHLEFGNIQAAITFLESIKQNIQQRSRDQIQILLSYCYFLWRSNFEKNPICYMPQKSLLNGLKYQFLSKLIKHYRHQLQNSFKINLRLFKEGYASHFINFGIEARKSDKIDYAIKYFAKALERSSGNLRAKLQMAECLKLSEKEYSALKYYKEVLDQHENSELYQIKLRKRTILIYILQLYVKLFTINNQLELIQIKETLIEAEKILKAFYQLLTTEQQKLASSQLKTIQKLENILYKKEKVILYFDFVKLYYKNQLPEFALKVVSQAKRDIFGYTDSASEVDANIQASYHTSRIFIELQKFQQAQQCLTNFWIVIKNNLLQVKFRKQLEESYKYLVSILRQKNIKHKPWNMQILEPFFRLNITQNYKLFLQFGNLMLEDNQLKTALKCFLKTQKLDQNKSTVQKNMEIYKIQPSLMQQDQILSNLLDDYEEMIENNSDYQFLITAAKLLNDFTRVQRFYKKIVSQIKTSQLYLQISKDLAQFYQRNELIERACFFYAQYFIRKLSKQTFQKLQIMIQKQNDTLLTNKQFYKIIVGLITEITDFQKLLVSCRYNQYNSCFFFLNKWIKQLRNSSPTQFKKEVQSKTILIKKISSNRSLCSLFTQSILYAYLLSELPTNKTIQNILRINICPQLFKALGMNKNYFEKEQIKVILERINQNLDSENMRLILYFILGHNERMQKTKENEQILYYFKQNYQNIILQQPFAA